MSLDSTASLRILLSRRLQASVQHKTRFSYVAGLPRQVGVSALRSTPAVRGASSPQCRAQQDSRPGKPTRRFQREKLPPTRSHSRTRRARRSARRTRPDEIARMLPRSRALNYSLQRARDAPLTVSRRYSFRKAICAAIPRVDPPRRAQELRVQQLADPLRAKRRASRWGLRTPASSSATSTSHKSKRPSQTSWRRASAGRPTEFSVLPGA